MASTLFVSNCCPRTIGKAAQKSCRLDYISTLQWINLLPQQTNVGKRNRRFLWLGVAATSLVTALVTSLIWTSPLGRALDWRVARPFDFYLRDLLGKSPAIDPRLKIYAYDDVTKDKLHKSAFLLSDWAILLESFANQKPESIVIDKVFGVVNRIEPELDDAVKSINKISVPIRTGVAISYGKLSSGAVGRFNDDPNLVNPTFDLANVPEGSRPVTFQGGTDAIIHGADNLLKKAFSNGGHINHEGYGTVAALVKINKDLVVPHLALLVAGGPEFKDKNLYANHFPVFIDEEGLVNVNFINPQVLNKERRSIYESFIRAKLGRPNKNILADDIVVILPEMYTGQTDNTMTPYGVQPGGAVIVSMINSVLTGQWIKNLPYAPLYVCLAALGGALLGLSFSTFWFFIALILTGAVLLTGGALLFSTAGLTTPWFPVTFSFLTSGLFAFACRVRANEQQSRILKSSLAGLLPEQRLRDLIENPSGINLEFNEQHITIMFVDIVGFSAIPKLINPQAIFEELRRMLGNISDIIKEHGGIVDKSLGDGMMCYFGYRFGTENPVAEHARRAVDCALEIQRESMKEILETGSKSRFAAKKSDSSTDQIVENFKQPVLPLRIGINTAPAFVGNLGTNQRIDFTVIGAGVNFAKRLEAGCDLFTVLFSKETYDEIGENYLDSRGITPRFIEVKHSLDLQEVFEFDPFFADQSERDAGFQAYREYLPAVRAHERFKVAPVEICFGFQGKRTKIYDFSDRGIGIILDYFLTKGNQVTLELDEMTPKLRKNLEEIGISQIKGEVRWTTKIGPDYVHGLFLTNVSEGQILAMSGVFKDEIFSGLPTSRAPARISRLQELRKPG
jgi:class 3 adenylate cyclase